MQNKKFIVISIVIGCIVVLVGIFFLWKWFRGGNGITHVVLDRSTYDVALTRATAWQPDAALMKMTLADASNGTWDFIFVSLKVKNKGLEVVANGQGVLRADEIMIVGSGTALPADSISPDEAMAKAHMVPGYGNATIVSLEMIYSAASRGWYWGVKTDAGVTITVKATP